MFKYIKIAWRNLWRNTRRTLITSASVFFGVFFAIFMTSLQKGSFENMIGNMARFYSGYIQIQESEFKESPGVNHSFEMSAKLREAIDNNPNITSSTNRVETFALASNKEKSFPAFILGINPEQEDEKSGLSKHIVGGEYFKSGSKDLLVGKILAENLNLKVGDSLILLGQGFHGVTAVGIYKVAGLLDFPLPDLSKQIVYMDLLNCQEFASLQNRITSNVIIVDKTDVINNVIASLQPLRGDDIKIYSWQDLMPELLNLIEGKEASSAMIKSLLFMIIGFGILATIMMLMHERKRELGVMIAIGFQKSKLLLMMLTESAFIGIIGVLSSLVVSYPLMYYLYKNPIIVIGEMAETYKSMGFEPKISFSISPQIFYNPAITVLIIFMLISLYQIYYIAKLKVVDSLKG
ncbi:MAG: ABC transporter permease [Bacteroidetes bacterium]|nr:ABC transporter permease [Bacteroidota bacterium]MBL6944153.1 ABC transporter permease [Bacteroidales bacterium]